MIKITTDDLRRKNAKEGLVLQGCGGDLREWVDGINDMFTGENILLDGTKFNADKVCVFQNDELTNLLFPFDDSVKVNMGKLAMWRIASHNTFGGTWLSDYVENELGGFIPDESEKETLAPDGMKL